MAKLGFTISVGENLQTDSRTAYKSVFTAGYENTFAALTSNGTTWEIANLPAGPGSSGNLNYASLAYGGGKFVALSQYNSTANNSTTAAYSEDGITWTETTVPDQNWSDVVYGAAGFIGISDDYTTTAARSTDGITWTATTLPSQTDWYSITYGNNLYLATSNYLDPNITAYSTDGLTWNSGSMPAGGISYNLHYLNNKFLAVGRDATNAAYSTDGITWTETSLPSYGRWISAAYGNGRYVTISLNSDLAAYSTDAITWASSVTPMHWISGFTYNSDAGLFIGLPDYDTTYIYSTDGATWTLASLPANMQNMGWYGAVSAQVIVSESSVELSTTELATINGTLSNIQTQIDGRASANSPTLTTPILKSPNVISPTVKNYVCAMITAYGTNAAYSTDGITWEASSLPSSNHYNAVYGNGKHIALKSGRSSYSTNGVVWTENTTMPSGNWQGAAYGGGKFVCGAYFSTNIAISTDGITWTITTGPISSYRFGKMVYADGRFVGTGGYDTTRSIVSTDGITWTTGALPTGTTDWGGLAYGNSVWVATALSSTTAATSTDGITWVRRTMPNAGYWQDIAYGNSIFLAATYGTYNGSSWVYTLARSTDGITWTSQTVPGGNISNVGFVNGKFIGYGSDVPNPIFSTDGITWTVGGSLPAGAQSWSSLTVVSQKPVISYNGIYGEQIQDAIRENSYTVQDADKYIVIWSTADHTITLPDAASWPAREITIKQLGPYYVSTGKLNVKPLSSNTLGGTILSNASGRFAKLVSNGRVWVIMEAN